MRRACGRGLATLLLCAVAALGMLLFVEPAAAQSGGKVRIGAAVCLTGGMAKEGNQVKKGYDTWVEYVNTHGGIKVQGKAYNVEMVYYDDKSDTPTSAKLTEKLITEDKVNLILGPYSSGITAATAAIAEKYGYVTLAPMANGDFVFQRGLKYLFSVLPPASRAIKYIPDIVVKKDPTVKTYATVMLDHFFTLPLGEGIREHSKELGLTEVYYGKYPTGTSDFSSIITSVKAKKPDMIYVGGFFQDLVTFFRQAKEMDLNAKAWIASAGPANQNWVDVMKKDGDYVLTNTFYNPALEFKGGPFPTTKAFNDFWRAKYGEDCDHYSSCGFIAGVLLQMAVEKANSFEQAKIRDALANMDVETFFGRFKFDEKGQNIGGRENVMQIQNQKHILVWPEVAAGGRFIYPVPAWKDR